MKEILLYISIGPVQEFIAAARRCQDLWYGSYLLSQLSETCANAVQEALLKALGQESSDSFSLIFPAELSHQSSLESMVANKILFSLPTHLVGQVKEIAQAGENAIRARLKEEQLVAFKKLLSNESVKRFFNQEMAEAQLNELIEYSWIALPVDGSYREARIDADSVLAARKNSKEWEQISWNIGLEVPKSSLDGARESVIYEEAFDQLSEENRRRFFGIKKGERLCGVSLLKRLGAIAQEESGQDSMKRYRPAFHSTSHLSAIPLLSAIASAKDDGERAFAIDEYLEELSTLGVSLDEYKIRVGGQASATLIRDLDGQIIQADRTFSQTDHSTDRPSGYDGYLFYESRLEDIFEESCKGFSDLSEREKKEKLTSAASSLKHCLKHFNLKADQLSKYYAFVLADGDRMGAAIDALTTPEQHQALSRRLNQFTQGCRTLIEGFGGSLLYAGGDDVLALVPLHAALDASYELNTHFKKSLTPFFDQAEIKKLIDQKPTLSVGISIAHHLDSMNYALKLARKAEKAAKDAGRNALSVIVSRRSGSEYHATGQWEEANGLFERLKSLLTLIRDQALPHGVAHELISAIQLFKPHGEINESMMSEWYEECRMPLWREINRILGRKKIAQGQKGAFAAQEQLLASLKPYSEIGSGYLITATRQLSDEMLIAKLLSSAYQVAWSKA